MDRRDDGLRAVVEHVGAAARGGAAAACRTGGCRRPAMKLRPAPISTSAFTLGSALRLDAFDDPFAHARPERVDRRDSPP
jgi:hypothetical protein